MDGTDETGQQQPIHCPSAGWWMLFRNPMDPQASVQKADLEKVMQCLEADLSLSWGEPRAINPQLVQVDTGRKRGNVQLFLTRACSSGNVRINCSRAGRVKDIRAALLRSVWFVDMCVQPQF